jgi:hypothetical protein
MYNILKLLLFPYFALGMVMAVACSSRSGWHPGLSGFAVLAAIHALLIVAAFSLARSARNAKENGSRLSPSGLGTGFVLAYVVGLVIFLFVMRT